MVHGMISNEALGDNCRELVATPFSVDFSPASNPSPPTSRALDSSVFSDVIHSRNEPKDRGNI